MDPRSTFIMRLPPGLAVNDFVMMSCSAAMHCAADRSVRAQMDNKGFLFIRRLPLTPEQRTKLQEFQALALLISGSIPARILSGQESVLQRYQADSASKLPLYFPRG